MNDIEAHINQVEHRISRARHKYHRSPGSVRLLAVSKTQSIDAIKAAHQAHCQAFGENQCQEAIDKIKATTELDLEWHFIGTVQSNKTHLIAEHFHWVQSVDRLKIARRLNDQRPEHLPPLNICVQVNISNESNKAGIPAKECLTFCQQLSEFPRLQCRGLMCIPKPCTDFEQQVIPFQAMQALYQNCIDAGLNFDTLSMGMSADLEAAIAAGSTMVRVGTAIFGDRKRVIP